MEKERKCANWVHLQGHKKRKWGCEIIASAHIVDLTEWGGAGVGNWAHYPPTKTHDEQPTAQVPTQHYKTFTIHYVLPTATHQSSFFIFLTHLNYSSKSDKKTRKSLFE